jgi:hypothetical protein
MEVENIPGEGFASRGTAQKEGKLPISHGVFGEVIVNAKGMPSRIPEVLSHGTASIGRDIL